ncbi:SUMF1/EgtB/PvdO family nonheme iron enzyme [bacterium]|nr:SUMF1/EgtB/PvdO family nonheme iron enzyme [bacterium]
MEDEFHITRLKNYVLQERLGRGGMGMVYRAISYPVELEVALKIFMPPPGMFDPGQESELRSRFLAEGYAMARMQHPNVMTLKHFDIENDIPYYTMDILPVSLAALIGEDEDPYHTKPLPEEEVIRMACQICDGLAYMHRKNVIHRDIKPGNILVTDDNQIKISDFGISDIGDIDFTMYGDGFMSVAYCAPEQRMTPRQREMMGIVVDHRADLYSLGITLYKLLTGRFPSFGSGAVSQYSPNIRTKWDEIFFKILQEHPDKRYQSAEELKTAILGLLNADETPAASEMVPVGNGEFLFGKEKEVRCLNTFCIDRHPVTNRQYRQFISVTNHAEPAFWKDARFNQDDQPVVGVSLEDAQAYAKWTGKRLPTEEEWEKAARGTEGCVYPWGRKLPDEDCCNFGQHFNQTTPVNRFDENNVSTYGCCDMTGNVWEWTETRNEEDHSLVVVKGGSWLSFAIELKLYHKEFIDFKDKKNYIGFRCVRDRDETGME